MKLAFCLIKYFPFGGLQRDFMRMARICQSHGHQIDVYTGMWQGAIPPGFDVTLIHAEGLTNHRRRLSFIKQLNQHLGHKNYDAIVGFNKFPNLDVYFAADPCFAEKANSRNFLYRLTQRCRIYMRLEAAVFSKNAKTEILSIAEQQQELYIKHYGTPEHRFHPLPPGISRDRLAPDNSSDIRADLRRELNIGMDQNILLMIGTGYKRKGVDRAIRALAALQPDLFEKTLLLIIGENKLDPYRKLAKRLGILDHVRFLGGRSDVPRFLLAADLLLHPARQENTGTVLIEAMASELPILATDVCGYANYVKKADAGLLIPSPFRQTQFDQLLDTMLTSDQKTHWQQNAKKYVTENDVFSLSEKAVEIIERVAAC